MKRLSVLVIAALFACLLAFESCYAQAGAKEDTGTTVQGAVAPPSTPGASSGQWVQVPGESIGGKWVPPHSVWVPTRSYGPPPPPAYAPVPAYGPVPAYVVAPPPTFASVFCDIVILRPLGIAGLAVGTAAAVAATPFALPSGSEGVVGRTLIGGPYDFTFRRPLGVW